MLAAKGGDVEGYVKFYVQEEYYLRIEAPEEWIGTPELGYSPT